MGLATLKTNLLFLKRRAISIGSSKLLRSISSIALSRRFPRMAHESIAIVLKSKLYGTCKSKLCRIPS